MLCQIIENCRDIKKLDPVPENIITEAEKQLNLKFADEYRKYLARFGAISGCGIEITGITKSKMFNVVHVTQEEKKFNKYIPDNQYVVETLGIGGIVILQDETGIIYTTIHNRKPQKTHNSLYEYFIDRRKMKDEI